MSKYDDLLNILDRLRLEAPHENTRYYPDESDIDKVNGARSRAYIHLFLKVKFGMTDFSERENVITDGPSDGGIDGYFIDSERKVIYLIQSKFRMTDSNFRNKEIAMEELLSMDIKRIMVGEETDEDGNPYNGKIKVLIRRLREISDMPNWDTKVVLLANVKYEIQSRLTILTGGYAVDVYNYERVYKELVFPLISGSYYNIDQLKITINVDKNSSGHRIQYYPETQYGECTVNALFVPTLEIAKILSKYKNSILRYNPRSYLDLQKGSVNEKIAFSIENIQTNEFALFNNGITMLSDETKYSDTVGKRNTAEVLVTNPQIINGGQTAYTLSILYDRHLKDGTLDVFKDKEVLLKIISFNESEGSVNDKLKLIEDISIATNQQSPVYEADRRANDKVQVRLQELIYDDFGLYYERKLGEFGDGIHKKYIDRSKIIDREQFLRICLVVKDEPVRARSTSINKLFEKRSFDTIIPDSLDYRRCIYTYLAYEKISNYDSSSYNVKNLARYAIASVVSHRYNEHILPSQFEESIAQELTDVISKWEEFEKYVRLDEINRGFYFREAFDPQTGEKTVDANWGAYYKGRTLNRDLAVFFGY
jgi:hypothetical protein